MKGYITVVESVDSAIDLFIRDKDLNLYTLRVPYQRKWYYPKWTKEIEGEEAPYITVYGDPVKVSTVKDRDNALEGDVPDAIAFLLDTGLGTGIEFSPDSEHFSPAEVSPYYRLMFLDLETFSLADRRVISYAWKSWPDGSSRVYSSDSERDILTNLVRDIRGVDPDYIGAWNARFDISVLYERLSFYRMRDEIARGGSFLRLNNRYHIYGREIIDFLCLFRRLSSRKRLSYSLDSVAKDLLGIGKTRENYGVSDLYKEGKIEELMEYNLNDVLLLEGIVREAKLMDLLLGIREMSGCRVRDIGLQVGLGKAASISGVIDVMVLREARSRGILLPRSTYSGSDSFEGAKILEPVIGVHRNVAVLDFTSMYPSIIVSFNISPDSLDPEGEIRLPNGVSFRKDPPGILPSIMERLLTLKKSLSKKDPRYFPTKVLLNSFYGIMTWRGFRLKSKACAESITFIGRSLITKVSDYVNNTLGYQVIYGDTDSIFVKVNSIDDVKPCLESINKFLHDWCLSEFGIEALLEMSFDKFYRVFIISSKKVYVGMLEEGELDGRNILVRTDMPLFAKEAQEDVAKTIMEFTLKGLPEERVVGEVIKVVNKHKERVKSCVDKPTKVEYIGKPIEYIRDYEDYEETSEVRRAIENSMRKGIPVRKGEKIVIVRTKEGPVAFPLGQEIIPSKYRVDIGHVLSLVESKIKPLTDALGIDENRLKGQVSLQRWFNG